MASGHRSEKIAGGAEERESWWLLTIIENDMSKTIIVKWIPVKDDQFSRKEMRVIYSDHERFGEGTRFDYGFMNIAIREGYTIIVLPL